MASSTRKFGPSWHERDIGPTGDPIAPRSVTPKPDGPRVVVQLRREGRVVVRFVERRPERKP
jgi:hypothetical protein